MLRPGVKDIFPGFLPGLAAAITARIVESVFFPDDHGHGHAHEEESKAHAQPSQQNRAHSPVIMKVQKFSFNQRAEQSSQ